MQQRAKTIKKTTTPKLLIFSMISSAFDFPLLLVPLNRTQSPYNFLKNYGILGAYSFAVLETCFFFFFQNSRTCFYHVIACLAISLTKTKENRKVKTEIWKQLEVVFENKFVFSGK
jgi:hypothetical protein